MSVFKTFRIENFYSKAKIKAGSVTGGIIGLLYFSLDAKMEMRDGYSSSKINANALKGNMIGFFSRKKESGLSQLSFHNVFQENLVPSFQSFGKGFPTKNNPISFERVELTNLVKIFDQDNLWEKENLKIGKIFFFYLYFFFFIEFFF